MCISNLVKVFGKIEVISLQLSKADKLIFQMPPSLVELVVSILKEDYLPYVEAQSDKASISITCSFL